MPAANDHMSMLENNLGRVASYFQDPHVKYAALNYLMGESIKVNILTHLILIIYIKQQATGYYFYNKINK